MKRREDLGFKIVAGAVMLGLLAPSCTARQRDFGTSGSGAGGGGGDSGTASASSSAGAGGAMSSGTGGMSKGCTSDADMTSLNDTMTVDMAGQQCGLMCVNDPNRAACSSACMAVKANLSASCAQCWGERLACLMNNCLQSCAQPGSQVCRDCGAMYCDSDYHACAGV